MSIPAPRNLGRVYRPHLAIHASPTAFAAALEGLQAPNDIAWAADTRAAHADYLAFSEKATEVPGAVNLGEIMVWLRDRLSPDDILCNGAGNFSAWLHRFYRFRKFGTLLRPDLGLDGLWRAGGGRGEAALSGAQRVLPRRRRRLPDERAGIRHRRAI